MLHSIQMSTAIDRVSSLIKEQESISFFVGAGISKKLPSYMPDWAEFRNALLLALVNKLHKSNTLNSRESSLLKEELVEFSSHQGLWLKPEVVLQWLSTYISGTIYRMLQVFTLGCSNQNHWTLAHLSTLPNVVIATCNFDMHIENAIRAMGKIYVSYACRKRSGKCLSFREFLTNMRNITNESIPLLKIHGCASSPSSIKATLTNVSKPLSQTEKKTIRSIVRQRFLVVAGYSGRDADILSEIRAEAPRSKGILWLAHKESSSITDVKKIPNVMFSYGDVNAFFADVCEVFGFKCPIKKGIPISVHEYAKNAAQNARTIPTSLALSELAMHIGCHATVKILSQKVILSSSDPRDIALSWMSYGDSIRRSEPNKALENFKKAELAAHQIKAVQPILYSHTLKYIAAQYYVLGDLESALVFNSKSKNWARKVRNYGIEGRILDDRALIFRQRGNVSHAIRLRFQSVKLLIKEGDIISLAMVYNNLGKDYDAIEQFDKAVSWWLKSLKLKEEQTSDSPDIARTCFNIGENLRHIGKIDEAFPYLKRANSRSTIHNDHIIEARSLFSLAAINFSNGELSESKRLLHLAKKKTRSIEDWNAHSFRVHWAKKIEKMINVKHKSISDRQTKAEQKAKD